MPEIDNLLQYAIAAAIIFLILAVLLWIMRRAGGPVRMKRGDRLSISETRALDKTRHLVLVQCDDEEHLLLIGGPQDIVVKTNVGADIYETADYQPLPYDVDESLREPAFDLPREEPAVKAAEEEEKPEREKFKSRFSAGASSLSGSKYSSRSSSSSFQNDRDGDKSSLGSSSSGRR
ncbi:MAG: flagellar biosynthetic protein FliO [Hyphomicrobiales bacterium]